ncbi:gephyrin-like molybdotransferase Glp [Rhodosalinus sp.]|uniref:molybdopterin molybdotransferase MoeA n=1 Tax=Rhodosalinus sp. TaxID=2047741 RepID=UPI00397E4CC3
MISVAEALERLFALVAPLEPETVPLRVAAGRVLAEDATALRDQPPFPASAMDGYAVRGDAVAPGARFTVIGEAPAGRRFAGRVGSGEAVRIFTGAPMPEGTDRVVIQEDVTREGDMATVTGTPGPGPHVRPAGADFRAGDRVAAPRRLSAADLALLAAMNLPEVRVTRRPSVAILSTGDELVMPGEAPGDDQIVASNVFALAALLEAEGAEARILPIARDTESSLRAGLQLAQGADLILTVGGASVGDHDLVAPVAAALGMDTAFYKVAMRPGKPLMAGRLGASAMIGLPGNPVSAIVCGTVFVAPVIRKMLGLGAAPAPRLTAPLARDIAANGPREHYMRARLGPEGLEPFASQDSALLSLMAEADALLIRPPSDGPRAAGETVEYLPLPRP